MHNVCVLFWKYDQFHFVMFLILLGNQLCGGRWAISKNLRASENSCRGLRDLTWVLGALGSCTRSWQGLHGIH